MQSTSSVNDIIRPTDLFSNWAAEGRDEKMARGHENSVFEMLEKVQPYLPSSFSFADIGCGNGWVCRLMKKDPRVTSCWGVDGAEKMIEKASRLESESGTDVLQQCDFFHSSFDIFQPPAKVDVVFSMEVLYYLEESQLKTFLSSLRKNFIVPGGLLMFGIDHFLENEACHGWATLNKTFMLLWSEEKWKQVVEEAGFEVIHHYRAGRGPSFESGTLAIIARSK